jgi:hypothetical protein
VDQSDESVASLGVVGRSCTGKTERGLRWLWWRAAKAAVPPVGAVAIAIDAEHVLEASLARDQQPVQALAASGADEALGVRVAFGA